MSIEKSFKIRKARTRDDLMIFALYQQVSEQGGGIIRIPDEINLDYIQDFSQKSQENGLQLIGLNGSGQIIAEVHAYGYGLRAFRHVLGDLTIVVRPDFQGQGIGKSIFVQFLKIIKEERRDILRVELFVREKNTRSIRFYESLGFEKEGIFKNRILNENGLIENPIPMAWQNPRFIFP